jgi:hypothetical protein
MAAILKNKSQYNSYLKTNHASRLAMPNKVENDTSYVLLARMVAEISQFKCIFKALAAILNFEPRKVSRHFPEVHRSSFSSKMCWLVKSVRKKGTHNMLTES